MTTKTILVAMTSEFQLRKVSKQFLRSDANWNLFESLYISFGIVGLYLRT